MSRGADKRKDFVVLLVEVVEEDSPDPARFVAMLDEEVVVTPLLEASMIGHRGVLVANIPPGSMKVNAVLPIRVVRSEIGPSPKPRALPLGKKTKVGMHRGDFG